MLKVWLVSCRVAWMSVLVLTRTSTLHDTQHENMDTLEPHLLTWTIAMPLLLLKKRAGFPKDAPVADTTTGTSNYQRPTAHYASASRTFGGRSKGPFPTNKGTEEHSASN